MSEAGLAGGRASQSHKPALALLACAAKSNAVYVAYSAAMEDAKSLGSLDVPLHLRNAPTRLMKQLDYGKGYRYAHDEPDALRRARTISRKRCSLASTIVRCRAASRSRSRRRCRSVARSRRS